MPSASRRAAAVAALLLVLTSALPAAATTPQPSLGTGATLQRLDRARDAIAGGALTNAIDAAAVLGGQTLATGQAAARPAGLQASVTVLQDAIALAGRRAQEAVSVPHRTFARRAAALRPGDASGTAELVSAVDRAALLEAAHDLAAVVEVSILALQEVSLAGLRSGRDRVAGCDLVDQPPALCVGGPGANSYRGEYALQIDLGGDDTYTNAGASDALGNGLPAAVTIDVGGNDSYIAELPETGTSVALGSAAIGGIGFLVDVAGNDGYAVTAAAAARPVNGIGYAIGGVGLLADAAGNDQYQATYAPVSGGTSRVVSAIGVSSLAGAGIVLDGGGNDRYTAQATPHPIDMGDGAKFLPAATVYGIGQGVAGVGLVADSAGTDEMSVVAMPQTWGEPDLISAATVKGLGDGEVGGVGVVLAGAGDTTYTARAVTVGEVAGSASVTALGVGGLAGYGAIDDVAGNDTYTATASTSAQRWVNATDPCDEWCDVDAEAFAGAAVTSAMGFASLGAAGVLRDNSGNDRYISTATAKAQMVAHDYRDAPQAAMTVRAHAGRATSKAQGVAAVDPAAVLDAAVLALSDQLLLEDGAIGLLLDGLGDDRYESVASATADAIGVAETTPVTESATTGPARSRAQGMGGGGGHGQLRDLGGTDAYRSNNTTAASSLHGSADPGTTMSEVQGSGPDAGEDSILPSTGLLIDIDGSAADTFSALPVDPVCEGGRGQASWRDCGSQSAGGVNS